MNLPDRVLYLGPRIEPVAGTDTTRRLLENLDFASPPDLANAVAAFLTVPFRAFWPGQKPCVALTANKSFAGKGTVLEFLLCDGVPRCDLHYSPYDWPMLNEFVDFYRKNAALGVMVLDNVRCKGLFQSVWVESLVTQSKVAIAKATGGQAPQSVPKDFIMLVTTNQTDFIEDLINRSLPIHMEAKGDVAARQSPIGNPKEYVTQNVQRLVAERHGMIDRWVREVCPLDMRHRNHPFSTWACTIGGVLQVNGFAHFLGNLGVRRAAADPMRGHLQTLAARLVDKGQGHKWLRPKELGELAVEEGLAKELFPRPGKFSNIVGQALAPYLDVELVVNRHGPVEGTWLVYTYRLRRHAGRFGGANSQTRYRFEQQGAPRVTDQHPGQVYEP
jgi:hypothetical protein